MDLARESLALVLVFGLLWAALWLLRRKGNLRFERSKQAPARLKACGKLTLSAHHSIHLVRAGDRELILALHPEGVTFLGNTALEYQPGAEQEGRAAQGGYL